MPRSAIGLELLVTVSREMCLRRGRSPPNPSACQEANVETWAETRAALTPLLAKPPDSNLGLPAYEKSTPGMTRMRQVRTPPGDAN